MKNLPPPTNSVPNHYDFTLNNLQILINLLTTRELQILEFAVEGFTNKEIAELHYIEETTVKRHRQNIMDKIGIAGRVQMRIFMRSVQTMLKNGAKSTISDSEN
ncbi:MAG: helix-turn-helix transcriptional regulator [Arcicella sp.]|nr:helix-turn-helix transcriptional regulator [Arcicella sp.]